MDNSDSWLGIAVAALVLVGLIVWYVIHKGRAREGEHVYRASRLTKGNRIFPSQVVITSTSVTLFKPQWIGKVEESVHTAHVSSISIDTNVIWSNVSIETTGGHNPLVCSGHSKSDAVAIKSAIEKFQSQYYKQGGGRV